MVPGGLVGHQHLFSKQRVFARCFARVYVDLGVIQCNKKPLVP
ncbi:hypothetical protein BN2537_5527 [Streptomyces venezuelae]|nr:hypothetical protein BN2537_5527 [Streptomyces venezuelae]